MSMIERIFSLLVMAAWALGLLGGAATHAGPLNPREISADAKWLLHVDLDQLRATSVGKLLFEEGQKTFALAKESLPFKLDFAFDSIQSITAFGESYESGAEGNGVLLLRTTRQTQESLLSLAQGLLATASDIPVKKIEASSLVLYSFDDEIFAGVAGPGTFIAGKSREEIDRAIARLQAAERNEGVELAFRGFPEAPRSFFFLGIAEGFNAGTEMPPQARVLQMAEGGRLLMGETGGKLFLNLLLKTNSPEVGLQIQQVIQGMMALASLSQMDNKDLLPLIQSAKVAAEEKTVTVQVEYPVARALEVAKGWATGHREGSRRSSGKENRSGEKGGKEAGSRSGSGKSGPESSESTAPKK